MSGVENETSQLLLQMSRVTSRLKALQQALGEQREALQRQHQLVSHSETEIVRSNALIERKQTQIDQLSKKVDQRLSTMEGVRAASPLAFLPTSELLGFVGPMSQEQSFP